MEIEKFIKKNEFLYHLTDIRNFEIIKSNRIILSTESIVNVSDITDKEKKEFLSIRRPIHCVILIKGKSYFVRDQRPISEKNLKKCLTDGWSVGDFLQHLNRRVFFWPNLSRLSAHFNRYETEKPIIIKVSSESMFNLNSNPEFCRLNSGATRSNSRHGGAPPPRGKETFLPAIKYQLHAGSVAEVTFPNSCILPKKIFIGFNPKGPWQEIHFPS